MEGEKDSPLLISSSLAKEPGSSTQSKWTKLENKLFENALAILSERTPDRWEKVAEMIPGKTPEEVEKQYYKLLVNDVELIESCQIPIRPPYLDESEDEVVEVANPIDVKKKRAVLRKDGKPRRTGRGIPWSEEEHRSFLVGLEKFGKGDWKSIARSYVVTKTPTQVASHAQKHFKRLNNPGMREKQRPSLSEVRNMIERSTLSTIPNLPIIPNPSPFPSVNYSPMAGAMILQTFNAQSSCPSMMGGLSGFLPEQPPNLFAGFGSFGGQSSHNLSDGPMGDYPLNTLAVEFENFQGAFGGDPFGQLSYDNGDYPLL